MKKEIIKEELDLIQMSGVETKEVDWLWYPYIPYGKVTVVQGDPGEGKTTFVLSLLALLTKGEPLLEEEQGAEPVNVIYQTAEDGLGDTIKPRLEQAGADLDKVFVINESEESLSMTDERIMQAVEKTSAKVVVLDPIQAYLGAGVDMHRANEIRPIFSRLSFLAEKTGCAIILIGHLNKSGGSKSAYRGIGSIDIGAAVRSVLVIGRDKEEKTLRIVAHSKSNLAPEGQSIAFELNPETGFQWRGYCETTVDDLLSGKGSTINKTTQAENLLKEILAETDLTFEEVKKYADEIGVSHRTLMTAKKNIGVDSTRKGSKWYWSFQECKSVSS